MTVRADGWSTLFSSAFAQSRNAMALVDERRVVVDVNAAHLRLLGHRRDEVVGRPLWTFVAGGPVYTPEEWARSVVHAERVTGRAELLGADGTHVAVQWAATPTAVGARRIVLLVALSTSRWGAHFRAMPNPAPGTAAGLTRRELQVVTLIAHGSTSREIAEELHVSYETVRTHVGNAMAKLGARSRAHLVAKAVADGLIR